MPVGCTELPASRQQGAASHCDGGWLYTTDLGEEAGTERRTDRYLFGFLFLSWHTATTTTTTVITATVAITIPTIVAVERPLTARLEGPSSCLVSTASGSRHVLSSPISGKFPQFIWWGQSMLCWLMNEAQSVLTLLHNRRHGSKTLFVCGSHLGT